MGPQVLESILTVIPRSLETARQARLVLMPLAQAFIQAGESSRFINIWRTEVAKHLDRLDAANCGNTGSSIACVWLDARLGKAIAMRLTESLTHSYLAKLYQEMLDLLDQHIRSEDDLKHVSVLIIVMSYLLPATDDPKLCGLLLKTVPFIYIKFSELSLDQFPPVTRARVWQILTHMCDGWVEFTSTAIDASSILMKAAEKDFEVHFNPERFKDQRDQEILLTCFSYLLSCHESMYEALDIDFSEDALDSCTKKLFDYLETLQTLNKYPRADAVDFKTTLGSIQNFRTEEEFLSTLLAIPFAKSADLMHFEYVGSMTYGCL